MEPYRGKGNHSVKELERLIEQREEHLHLIKSGQAQARIDKLEKALRLLHNNCLYQLNDMDDRPTHVPMFVFNIVEQALRNDE